MNTIKNLVLFLFAMAVVTGCNKATYKENSRWNALPVVQRKRHPKH
ncbi:MAG: hypothetical protein IPO53_09900 [Chitinophagaceae bacterium]|nr:hypothetical protein [Chitinophagaceae bacterium]